MLYPVIFERVDQTKKTLGKLPGAYLGAPMLIQDRRYEWVNRAGEKFGLVDSIGFELSSKGVQADAKTPGCLGFVLA